MVRGNGDGAGADGWTDVAKCAKLVKEAVMHGMVWHGIGKGEGSRWLCGWVRSEMTGFGVVSVHSY